MDPEGRNRRFSCLFLLLVSSCLSKSVAADYSLAGYSREQALAFSQGVIGKQVNGHRLLTRDESTVEISSYQGKPLVVSFIYTSCYHFCPTITRNLSEVIEIANETLGTDRFNVLSVGIDTPHDTPERMRQFAAELNISYPNWQFVSVSENVVGPLTEDLGFLYAATPRGFDHLAQITILDADGNVYRQVYGTSYDAQKIVEPLKDLVFDRASVSFMSLSDLIDNIRLFCTIYDPASGRYKFDYSIVLSFIIGVLCLGSILVFVINAWRSAQDPKLPL
ncbi:MAG: SCO family protein [Thiotrichales bacterium]|nr:SCO family protein [Thiotrichales bacterium]